MKKNLIISAKVIAIIILIILFLPISRMIYVSIFGHIGSGLASINIGVFGEYLIAFFISYSFILPMFLVMLFNKPEKYYAIFAFIGFEILFIFSDIVFLFIILIIVFISVFVGEVILRAYNALKK